MKKSFKIKAIDAFQISNLGIIVFVQNANNGLPTDCVLKSLNTGISWVVKSRIIEFSELDNPEFNEETITNLHLTFSSAENRNISQQQTLERISQNIFQYQIEGIGHDEKPALDEELEVMVPPEGQLRVVSFDDENAYVIQRFSNEILSVNRSRIFRDENLAIGLYVRYCEHRIYDIVDVSGNFVFGN